MFSLLLVIDYKNYHFLKFRYFFILGTNYPVGRMEINSIENLKKLSVASSTVSISNKVSLADIDYSSDSEDEEGVIFLFEIHLYISYICNYPIMFFYLILSFTHVHF